jgi:hypothetical protein
MRQQLLILYLAAADLDSGVVGWSRYDGTAPPGPNRHGDETEPPYSSVVDAMRDGWRVIQFPSLPDPAAGADPYRAAHLRFEYVLEKLVDAR